MTAERALYIVLVFSAFKKEYFLAERALNRQKIFKRIVAAIVFTLVTIAAAETFRTRSRGVCELFVPHVLVSTVVLTNKSCLHVCVTTMLGDKREPFWDRS